MSAEQSIAKKPLTWELLISSLGFGLCAIFLAQKHELFQNLARPLTESPNSGTVLWMAAVTVMLMASTAVKRRSKLGFPLRILALACCTLMLAGIFSLNNSWVRYRILKHESLSSALGLSQESGLRTELHREMLQAGPGTYITDDLELLKYLVFQNGDEFQGFPTQALIAFTALQKQDVGFQELWDSDQGKHFLLSALLGETNPRPWYGLDWLQKSDLNPQPQLGLNAGLFTQAQAQQILQHHLKTPPEQPEALEELLLATLSFPSLAQEEQRVEIFEIWGQALKERAKFLSQGLEVRELVRSQLSITEPVTLRVEVTDKLEHMTWQDKELPSFVPHALCSFLRSCGLEVTLVDSNEADITIKVLLDDIDLYEYEAPVYGLETVTTKKYVRIGRTGTTRHVSETKSVVTGSQTKTSQGAGLSFELNYRDQSLSIPPTLFYWWDAVFKEQDYRKNKSVHKDGTFGRTWPYGVHEKSFKYRFLQLDSATFAERY